MGKSEKSRDKKSLANSLKTKASTELIAGVEFRFFAMCTGRCRRENDDDAVQM